MFANVSTQFFIVEHSTEGHHPMEFLCDDGNNWYLKYILQPNEYNLLVNEMIGVALARYFSIPFASPGLAIVHRDSFMPNDLHFNKLVFPGCTCFASKQIEGADIVNELETIEDKWDFNSLNNPSDLIKIGLLDVLTDNIDRCRKNNYNILFKKDTGDYFAIDHGLIFSGNDQSGIFAPSYAVSLYGNLMQTPYFKKVVKFIPLEERKKVLDDFMYLCNAEIVTIVADVFSKVPKEWTLAKSLKDDMTTFLFDNNRINSIKAIAQQELII